MYSFIFYIFCFNFVTQPANTNSIITDANEYYSTLNDTSLVKNQHTVAVQILTDQPELTFKSKVTGPKKIELYKSLDESDLSFYYNFFLTKYPYKQEVIPNKTITNQMLQIEMQLKINKKLKQKSLQRQEILSKVNIYLTSLICFSGIIGNLLSLKVFFSNKLPGTSSITYLIALTTTDSLFLMEHFLEITCREIMIHFHIDFPLNLIDQKLTICRGFSLIRSACRCASPWIIVAFTLDRFVVVNYPIYSNIISRPRTARRLVFIILAMSVLISIYSPVLSGIVYYPKKNNLSNRLYRLYRSNKYETGILKKMSFEERFFEKSCDILKDYRKLYIYLTLVYTVSVSFFLSFIYLNTVLNFQTMVKK